MLFAFSFQALPYLTPHMTCVVVATPLNAILAEQVTLFGDMAIHVSEELLSRLSESPELVRTMGSFTYFIGHPEQLVSDVMRQLLMELSLTKEVIYFCFLKLLPTYFHVQNNIEPQYAYLWYLW